MVRPANTASWIFERSEIPKDTQEGRNTNWVDVCREGARAALMLFTPAQVDQCWLKALNEGTGREDATGSALIIWGQVLEKGFQQRTCSLLTVRKEGAVFKISSADISDEELGLRFAAITTGASRFRRTLDDGHLCSRCLLYGSFLSLYGNTDEYQYYFPLGGKRYWMVAQLWREGAVEPTKRAILHFISP